MVLEHFGGGPSCRSDGTEGTVKVDWYNGEEKIDTTEGCIVKNDDNFRNLLGIEDKKPNYFAYIHSVHVDLNHDTSSKAIIHVHVKYPNELNDCTVTDVKSKKKDVQEYTFVPCDAEHFNNSLFLKKHSKSIKTALDTSELCENRIQKVLALTKRDNPEGIISLKLKIEKNNDHNNFYIRKKFDKLEGTSPLFLTTRTSTLFNCCCSKKTTTLVGYYEKCEDKIAIYAFNTSTEPIDVYCSKEAASTASMFSNAVDAPTLGSPVGGTETSPSQQGTNSRQMAAGGLSNDPVHNTHSPTQEQGQSPGRTRENTSALAIGSSRRNDQPILPPGFQLEDIIDKNRMNYRRYLLHIAKNLTNNEWKVLGEALKIPDLEQIQNDYSGVKEQAYQMLIKWTECKSRPTLAILIGALNRTGQRQLVDEISNYLGDNIGQIQGGTPVQDFQQDIISDIQDDWKFIGRYLGLKESVIHGIKERYREPYERARQMLTKWKKANGNEATFQVLMVALQSVGKENVVRRLQGLAS